MTKKIVNKKDCRGVRDTKIRKNVLKKIQKKTFKITMNKPKITFGAIKLSLAPSKTLEQNAEEPEASGKILKYTNYVFNRKNF